MPDKARRQKPKEFSPSVCTYVGGFQKRDPLSIYEAVPRDPAGPNSMPQDTDPRSPALDKPPAPTAVDLEIARHSGGRTVAIDATPSRLQATKAAPPPSLMERVEELTRENGQLRLEIRNHQEMLQPVGSFVKGVKSLVEELENILLEFEQLQQSLQEVDEPSSGRTGAVTFGSGPPEGWSEITESWL